MSAAHTPGPWEAKTSRVIVAHRSHTNFHGETTHYKGELAWTQPVPEREGGDVARLANARLIAAAPELLEALEKLAAFADEVTGKVEPPLYPIAYAWEVIAKARGAA